MDCIFCAIAKKEIPAKLFYEDESTLAFADINPVAPVHLLIIPCAHHLCLAAVEEEAILAKLLMAAKKIAANLKLDDYRVVINNGPKAGQTVFHLHLHLLAGRTFDWPPG